MAHEWTPPSPLPPLIPWVGVFALLALVFNRRWKAWWIWLPLGVVAAGEAAVRPHLAFIPSNVLPLLALGFNSLAFGLAAVWLLAPNLQHRLRFVVFLKMLGLMLCVSGLAYLVRADWGGPGEAVGILLLLGVASLATIAGLSLAGWACRGRYHPLALMLWLAVGLAALWCLIVLPFFLLALLAGNAGGWGEFAAALTGFVGVNLAVVLPFLILVFANSFYRGRLRELLQLDAVNPPPVPPSLG